MVFLLVLAGSLLSVPTALAAPKVIVPPGNSGIDQYFETVPGVGGSSGVHHHNAGHNTAVGSSTRQALRKLGANGRGAAAVADATAPTLVPKRSGGTSAAAGASHTNPTAPLPSSSGSGKHSGGKGKGSFSHRSSSHEPAVAAPSGSSGSPVGELVRAVTAGTNGEGMGALQPIILAVVVLAAAAYVWHRRRRSA